MTEVKMRMDDDRALTAVEIKDTAWPRLSMTISNGTAVVTARAETRDLAERRLMDFRLGWVAGGGG